LISHLSSLAGVGSGSSFCTGFSQARQHRARRRGDRRRAKLQRFLDPAWRHM